MNTKTGNKPISAHESIALLFPNFKMPATSKILLHIRNHLAQHRITTCIVPYEVVQNNQVEFKDLERDEHLMQRLVAVINQVLTGVDPEQRRHTLLIGLNGGTRYMAAFAYAKKLGLVPDSHTFNIPGVLAFNIYTHLRYSKPTPSRITELSQINHMDIRSNLLKLTDTIIYDVYANLDTMSADTAANRKDEFSKAGLNFKQHCITCCDITKAAYFENQNGKYFLYTEVSGHNLQNAFLLQEDGTYECVHRLHGSNGSAVENLIDQFLVDTGVFRVQ